MQGIHPGFETEGRHRRKSKTGVLVAPRNGPKVRQILKRKRILLDKFINYLIQRRIGQRTTIE